MRALTWELGNRVDYTRFDTIFIPNVPPCPPSNMFASGLTNWEDLATRKLHDKSMWDAMTPPDTSILGLISDIE